VQELSRIGVGLAWVTVKLMIQNKWG
jgi:hypothetical protein